MLVLAGLVIATGCVNRESRIAEVKSGRLQEAKASWWGFDKTDSTRCLQDAINSGVKKLVVDNVGADWVVCPIDVTSNVEIVFADGVVVRAKTGAFREAKDRLFDINGRSNVILRGEGKVLFVMNKNDYMQHPDIYKGLGQGHTIRIYNSQDVLVQNLTLKSSGGDGVYVGSGGNGLGAKNVTLDRLICLDNPRQGISVTGAENLLMKDCKFNDTKGAAPQCGIDYEPNYARFSIVNCVAENCDFDGNALAGIAISVGNVGADSKPVSITFKNCRIRGNDLGVLVTSTGSGTPAAPGKIEFIGCTITDNANTSFAVGEHRVKNLEFVLRDCVIDNRKSKTAAVKISSGHIDNIYGLRIEGLTVIDDNTNRPPVLFISRFSNGLVDPVVKNVKVRNSAGMEKAFDCEAFVKNSAPLPPDKVFKTVPLDLKKLKPLTGKGKASGGQIRFREKSEYLQWAAAGQKIQIAFSNKPVHRYEGKSTHAPLEVVVWCPSRAIVDKIGIPFDGATNYTLNAAETGIYRFEIDARMQTATVLTDAPGQGMAAAENLYVFGCSGRLYFNVPAGINDVRIEAGGSPNEASSVFLLNSTGEQVDSGLHLEGSKILQFTRPAEAKAEVWSIKFNASKLFLRIGAPLVPLFASDPDNLLVLSPGE